MNATRRLSLAALAVACLHLVFGAIVRISGSGMGCGDHWPKCYGYWFPPFNRPDLIVEVSHRYLASILTLTVLSMAFVAWRNRRLPGVGGKGGAMRSAFGAVAAVFSAALLGGLTVKMGNAPWATVAHWLVAMTLLAMVATTAIRSGALGGASSLVQRGTQRARRSGFAAAGLAIFAVALGGLTAKYPGAAVGCTTVPMCGPNPTVETASVHVQITHRTLAVLLVLHLFGVVMMVRKRRSEEAPVVFKAAHIALGMVLLQLVVASSMVLFHLPPVLRSLHEATGVGIWLSCFTLAYLARRASNVTPPEPAHLPDPSPKGGISITREPVTGTAAIASMEAPDTRLALSNTRDVPVAQQIVEDCVAVAAEASAPSDEELPPALTLVPEMEIVEAEVEAKVDTEAEIIEPEPEPAVILSEVKDLFIVDEIVEIPTEEQIAEIAASAEDDVTAEAAIVAELILAMEDAAKEAALESAQARATEAAIVAEAIAAIAPAEEPVFLSEAKDPFAAEETAEETVEETLEALDWEPRRTESEELDEFSIAALEAEVAALEAAQAEAIAAPVVEAVTVEAPVAEAAIVEPEPIVVEAAPVVEVAPIVDAAPVVAEEPPVKAPTISPLPAPTMAVLVARGADFL